MLGSTVKGIGEEKCGFKKDINYSDHILIASQLREKIKEKKKVKFLAFMVLEKVYEEMDRHEM